ncbi:MAG TPA: hypothetical protein VL490_00780 [Mucilaginibacter sp.]|jgi:hypothetical protein|nr:hypothetical protein [Mucilaginibacter sp.]
MKKLLLVCAFVMGVSAVSFAQGRQPQTPEQSLTRLKAAVTGITDDQATKLTAIYTASIKSQDSLRTAVPDRDTRMPAQTALRTATNAKIKAVLTADQQKQFDAMPQRGRGGNGGGGGGN